MTCNVCKTFSCYLCGKQVVDYQTHFCNCDLQVGPCRCRNVCRLFTNPEAARKSSNKRENLQKRFGFSWPLPKGSLKITATIMQLPVRMRLSRLTAWTKRQAKFDQDVPQSPQPETLWPLLPV
jgi:hypothetical protein